MTEVDITFQDVEIAEVGNPSDIATISGTIDVNYDTNSFTGSLSAIADGTTYNFDPQVLINADPRAGYFWASGTLTNFVWLLLQRTGASVARRRYSFS